MSNLSSVSHILAHTSSTNELLQYVAIKVMKDQLQQEQSLVAQLLSSVSGDSPGYTSTAIVNSPIIGSLVDRRG
jgi:hypothetical protein